MTEINIKDCWQKRACPLCGETNISTPEVRAQIQAETRSFEEVREYFIGIREDQVFFSYYRCANCGILYCPYYFSDAQLDALYKAMPDNLLGAEKSIAERTQNGYVNWFLPHVADVQSYLELGPDIGLVTKEIIRNLEPTQVLLVEPNTEMHHDLSKTETRSTKVSIFRHLDQVHLADINFSVGIHVFDHLLNPAEQLQRLNSLTSEQGYIGIVVHNEKSLLRKLLGKKWPPFCLQHPQLFNRKTLEVILKQNGFKKSKISRSINHFSIKHIGSLAIDILGLPDFLKKLLPKVEIPIALGNQIGIFQKIEIE